MVVVQIVLLFIQLGFVVLLFYLCLAFVTGAPFVPSTDPTAVAMIKFARIKKGVKVYDLGSGNGKLLFLAAQQVATAVGLEINPLLVIWSRLRAFLSPYRGMVSTRWQYFWRANLSDSDVVFVYLLPWRMEKLEKKLKQELKPGAVIVSNSFIFPHWKILRQDPKHHVYVFRA